MHTLVKSVAAVAVAGAVALMAVSPAAAQPVKPWWWHHHRHHHYVTQYYYPPAPYPYPYYGYYPYYYDPGAAIAAGFIGGIFGTIIHHRVIHHR